MHRLCRAWSLVIGVGLLSLSCREPLPDDLNHQEIVLQYLAAAGRSDSVALHKLSYDSVSPWAFPASPAKRSVFERASKSPLEAVSGSKFRNGDTAIVGYEFPFLPDSMKCQYWDQPLQVQFLKRDEEWRVFWIGFGPC
jgi:hypothetical protein